VSEQIKRKRKATTKQKPQEGEKVRKKNSRGRRKRKQQTKKLPPSIRPREKVSVKGRNYLMAVPLPPIELLVNFKNVLIHLARAMSASL
jgi:hypothetical protein